MRYVAAFASSAVWIAVLDAIWLTLMADRLYRPVLGDWMLTQIRWPAAIAFYALFLVGLTVLATGPALQSGSWIKAAVNGAVFGLVAYATYDLTNQATLVRWSTTITVADMAWGTFLACTGAVAGYVGSRMLVR